MTTLQSGTDFAGHRIEGELGRGGMGVVYRARHLALDQMRALKVLEPRLGMDAAAQDRFRREARLAASIDHPSVVRVHDAGEQDGQLFISMQVVDGVDLGALLEDGSPSPKRTVAMLAQVAAGLDAAHAAGAVHRDVKPENILVADTPAGERAVLGDFGIGLLMNEPGSRLTADSQVLGTADYIAPEQVDAAEVGTAADVYSLACVAYRMLSGEVPFPAETSVGTLLAHRSASRPSACALAPELPAEVDAVLAEGMAVDPADRPAGAGAFVRRLEWALGETGTADRAADAATRPLPEIAATAALPRERSSRISLGVAIGAGVFSLLVAAVLVYLLLGDDSDPAPVTQPAALTIDVPRDPISVAAGAKYVWVASGSAGQVTAYDPEKNKRGGRHYAIPEPRAIAIGPGYVWAITANSLYRLAVDGDEDIDRSEVEFKDATDVSIGPKGIWVLDRGTPPEAVRIDPRTLEQSGDAFVGRGPQAIDAGPGAVWVTNTFDGTVTEIDPKSAEVVGNAIDVGGRPTDVAAGGGQVWVIDNLQGLLTPIETAGGTPVAGDPITTLPRPRGLALGFGSVWVASEQENTLERFDIGGDHALRQRYELGEVPADVSRGNDRIYTANSAGGTVSGVTP